MPNRVLREGFLDSEKINALDSDAQVFFVRLMLVVDDFGRFDARPELLKSKCYPVTDIRPSKVGQMLDILEKNNLVSIYTVSGKKYLQISSFSQRTRIMRSKFPAPDECQTNDSHPSDNCQTIVGVNPIQSDTESDTDTDTDTMQKIQNNKRPHLFESSPFYNIEVLKAALPDWPEAKVRHYWQAASDYSESKGAKYLNWKAAISTWERNDEKKNLRPVSKFGPQTLTQEDVLRQAEMLRSL